MRGRETLRGSHLEVIAFLLLPPSLPLSPPPSLPTLPPYFSFSLCWDPINPIKAIKDSLPEDLLPSSSLIFHWDEPTNLSSILGTKMVGHRAVINKHQVKGQRGQQTHTTKLMSVIVNKWRVSYLEMLGTHPIAAAGIHETVRY